MRSCMVLAAALLTVLCSCSDDQPGTESPAAVPGDRELMERHQEITGEGILADFVSAISADSYERAFGMLHRELTQAWTQEQFTRDWQRIKTQLSESWGPEPTSSFSGQSPQGPYQQATYRLESDWRGISSVVLVAMQVNGEPRIVDVQTRVTGLGEPSAEIETRTEEFVKSMISRDFESVTGMFAPAVRGQYPPQLLAQVSPVLADSVEAMSRKHYRICSNGRWYHAVRLTRTDDAASFVELVMSTEDGSLQIEGLSFKGRVRM